jgi:metal-responsive CopG/Arc/MetJ family transcriptional regulator
MASQRISIRIPHRLGQSLKQQSSLHGESESEVVRKALEIYLKPARSERSAYDLAQFAGLIGCVRRAPADLSTNRRYLKGLGNSK